MKSVIELIIGIVLAVLIVVGLKSDIQILEISAAAVTASICVLLVTVLGRSYDKK